MTAVGFRNCGHSVLCPVHTIAVTAMEATAVGASVFIPDAFLCTAVDTTTALVAVPATVCPIFYEMMLHHFDHLYIF